MIAAQVTQLVESWIASGILPAAMLAVEYRGQRKLHVFGNALMDSIWAVASISKPVTTVSVMQMVDAKKLFLDQPVIEVLPEFGPGREKILLRHLLTHSSGIGPISPLRKELGAKSRVAKIAEMPLLFEPGTACSYSTPAFDVAAAMVERVSGTAWMEYMNERVFAPLQMADTTFRLNPQQQHRTLPVYDSANHIDPWWSAPYLEDVGLAGGGLFSTAQDLCKFAHAFLSTECGILSKGSIEAMTSLQTPGMRNREGLLQTWGFGWYLNQDQPAISSFGPLSQRAYGHSGATGTWMAIDPESELIIVLLSNRLGIAFEEQVQMNHQVCTAVVKELPQIGSIVAPAPLREAEQNES